MTLGRRRVGASSESLVDIFGNLLLCGRLLRAALHVVPRVHRHMVGRRLGVDGNLHVEVPPALRGHALEHPLEVTPDLLARRIELTDVQLDVIGSPALVAVDVPGDPGLAMSVRLGAPIDPEELGAEALLQLRILEAVRARRPDPMPGTAAVSPVPSITASTVPVMSDPL